MNIFFKQLLIGLSLGVLTSGALADSDSDRPVRDLDLHGSDCIWIRTIRDYRPLDSRNLLIYGSARTAYFVRLAHPAIGLRTSLQIGFRSRDNQLCPYGGDQLVFGGGFANEAVNVRAISRISQEQVEELLVRFGQKEPDQQRVPAPREVKGAEIEELDWIE